LICLELISHSRIAPLDGADIGTETEYQTLVERFNIPDEFVWERETSVTHSFGHQSDEDGRDGAFSSVKYYCSLCKASRMPYLALLKI
jgi:hypothetical protein